MDTYEAILKRRSVRKFKQDRIETDTLKKLVNAARLAPQGSNIQPIKYIIANDKKTAEELFPTTAWAGAIRPQGDPKEGERPTGYIIVLADTDIKKSGYDTDAGLAMENIALAAVNEGLGVCMLGAINRDRIREILSIPDRFYIHTMIALGYPAESPVEEDEKGSVKYYKDESGVLHVPKRKMENVLVKVIE